MTIKEYKENFINTLSSLNYPIFLQGSLGPDEAYPDDFITFRISESIIKRHYDNSPFIKYIYFEVNFYSNNPDNVNTIPAKISELLTKAGYDEVSPGSDLDSDEETHTGWGMDFIIK